MAKAIKLRVLIDYEEADVFRDMLIRDDHTFLDLHYAIIAAFQFDNRELASFYLSNDEWDRGQEISLMAMGSADVIDMQETRLSAHITAAGQKLLYVYDFMRMWCFFVEIISIGPVSEMAEYPSVEMTHGSPPHPHSKDLTATTMAPDQPIDEWTEPREDGTVTDIDMLFDDLDLDDPTRFN